MDAANRYPIDGAGRLVAELTTAAVLAANFVNFPSPRPRQGRPAE